MALPNIFSKEVSDEIIARINKLTPTTSPLWGKMDVAKMLAHCCITYEFVFEPEKHKPASGFMKFILKLLVKNTVVSETQYKQNGSTAPAFIINSEKDFTTEKNRLIAFIQKAQTLGSSYFEGKESHSFGALTTTEWNNMFYKHIDHHLRQFGV